MHTRDPTVGDARTAMTGADITAPSGANQVGVPDRLRHMPALDGLRGLAVLAVMVFHLNYPIGRGRTLLPGGFLGVDIFFVLSGFLITSLLLIAHARSGRVVTLDFWARRVRRLLPALLVFLVLVALYGAFVSKPYELSTVRGGSLATLFYVQNFWQIYAKARTRAPIEHTWSLSIEEQFYIVWPLMLAALLRFGRTVARISAAIVVLIAASVVAMAVRYTPHNPFPAYLSTDTRAHSLLVGALIAVVTLRWAGPRTAAARAALEVAGCGALGAIVVLCFRINSFEPWLYRGGFLLIAVLAGVVVTAAREPSSPLLGRALSWRPLTAIGLISYGLYLYHIPVYYFLDPTRVDSNGIGLVALRFAVTFAIAIPSYLLIERPIRRGTPVKITLRWTAPVAIAAAAALIVVTTNGATPVPASASVQYAYYARALATPKGAVRVLVAGDELASSLGSDYPSGYLGHGILGSIATTYGCGVAEGTLVVGARTLAPPSCSAVMTGYSQAATAYSPQVAVLMVGVSEVFDRDVDGTILRVGSPGLERYLDQRLDLARKALTAGGAELLLATVPCMQPPLTGQFGFLAPYERDGQRVAWVNAVWRRYAAAHRKTVHLVDLNAVLCGGTSGGAALGQLRTADGVGFSAAGAADTWRWLASIAVPQGMGRHVELPQAP